MIPDFREASLFTRAAVLRRPFFGFLAPPDSPPLDESGRNAVIKAL
jgi:hypothetical protein